MTQAMTADASGSAGLKSKTTGDIAGVEMQCKAYDVALGHTQTKVTTEHAALMVQHKARENTVLENKTTAEIERESLAQKEREINERRERQREVAKLDQLRSFYGACSRVDVEHFVQPTSVHGPLLRIHSEGIG